MSDTSFFSKNLDFLLKQQGLNANSLQEKSGITQTTTSRILNGSTKNPRDNVVQQYAKFFNISIADLRYKDLTGQGEMTALPHQVQSLLDNTSTPISTTQIDPNSKIWLPLMDISFSCGDGVSIDCHFEDTKKKLAFEPDFLTSRGIKEQNVRLLYATGDSMEEFIYDGDVFAIDVSDTMVRDGQIYAVYFEGEAMLKQIFKEAGGKLILHSKNPKYRDKEVTEDNGADFRVIGRQFWRAG